MSLTDYFDTVEGTGILATSDSDGNVNLALYARPHAQDDDTIVLIMSDRLSYSNIQSNPKASYMFIEKGDGYKGKRLYLQKISEDNNPELVESLRRRKKHYKECEPDSGSTAVYFKVNLVRPLVGS